MAKQNDWLWFELITTDPDAAAEFYRSVVGWSTSSFPTPAGAPTYLVGSVDGRGVVGFMAKPPQMPADAPPFWSGYLYTDDADATTDQVKRAGGKAYREPFDVAGVGRLAVLGDPEGGLFNLMKPATASAAAPAPFGVNTTGHVSWCELHSDHPGQNFDWYQKLFGWTRGEAMDMGQGGIYQMFTTNDQPVTGGSCGKFGGEPRTHWLFYFSVDALEAAMDRVKQGSGTIFIGPHQVPGGSWIAIGNDPQGAVFALHSQQR